MIIHNILTISIFLVAAFMLGYVIFHFKNISRFISSKNLGIFERDLPGLKQVIVLANQVEKPSNTLAEAVEDNFKEGVKYLFLVSKSKAESELEGYYLIFEALAKIVRKKSNVKIATNELVEIKRLPYDWPDVPYIFYQFQNSEKDGNIYTIAFKGNQKGEGIAAFYEKLSPSHSESLALALLAEAPSGICKDINLVDRVDKIINMDSAKKQNYIN